MHIATTRLVAAATLLALVSGTASSLVTSRLDLARMRSAVADSLAAAKAQRIATLPTPPDALMQRLRAVRPAIDAKRVSDLETRIVNLEYGRHALEDRMTELETELNRAVHIIADAVDPNGGTTAAAASARSAIAEQADESAVRDAMGSKAPTVMEKSAGSPPWAARSPETPSHLPADATKTSPTPR